MRVEIDPDTGETRASPDGKSTRFEGEIVIYGHNVMKGYLKRPEENAAVFTKDGGFRTGDMGYIDPQGFLFITGRIKEQYKLENGKYVVPTPIEEAAEAEPLRGERDGLRRQPAVQRGPRRGRRAGRAAVGGGEHARLPNDDADLLADARVRALFKAEIEKHGGAFKGFEAIRDFALIGDGLHDRQRHAHAEPQAQASEGRRDLRVAPRADVRQGEGLAAPVRRGAPELTPRFAQAMTRKTWSFAV